MGIGAPELIIVLLVVLLLFGATRLPKLARSMGEASKEFKKGISEKEKEEEAATVPPASEQKVTMTQAELDALLAEREARARAPESGESARKDIPPPSS
jgi:sec-independent protein translocase protein TatA